MPVDNAVFVPGQVPPRLLGLATVIPAGRVSVKSAVSVPVTVALALPRVMVRVLVPPDVIVPGANPFDMVGAAMSDS